MKNHSTLLERATKRAHVLGFSLDTQQPHLIGERSFFAQEKLLLLATQNENKRRIVIKYTENKTEARSMKEERVRRNALARLTFSYTPFACPEEIFFENSPQHTLSITTYIPQETTFLERPLAEQFFLSLKALESLEGVHMVASSHHFAKKYFPQYHTHTYLSTLKEQLHKTSLPPFKTFLQEVISLLERERTILECFCDFLTHWDLVPHNLRIHQDTLYLLDHVSLRFGNKHEAWGRFLNFMLLHHPTLEKALVSYFTKNRSTEEVCSLKLMRLFRMAELIAHHHHLSTQTTGALRELETLRTTFWTEVGQDLLNDTTTPLSKIDAYRNARDALRSPEEKERQKIIH